MPRVRLRQRLPAADMPVPAVPAYAPPVYRPVIYDWTGIYGGIHVGGGVLNDVVTNTTTTALLNAGTQTKLSPFAVVGGAQAGFNIEFAPFVIGAEGTFDLVGYFRHASDAVVAADRLGKFDLDPEVVCDRDRQGRLRRQRLLVLCQGRRGVDERALHPECCAPASCNRRSRSPTPAAASPSAAASNLA